jgi:hypothetical protein
MFVDLLDGNNPHACLLQNHVNGSISATQHYGPLTPTPSVERLIVMSGDFPDFFKTKPFHVACPLAKLDDDKLWKAA